MLRCGQQLFVAGGELDAAPSVIPAGEACARDSAIAMPGSGVKRGLISCRHASSHSA